ncbi:MAG TPA: hypothetical protein VHL09_08630 [Dehalococcoidia bacterium]|nr:hypothetical protein [Dehalococcoidia bacterium]
MAESGGSAMPDPLALWKQMIESQDQQWSKALHDMMQTDAFAASMGSYLDNLVNVQGTITKTLDQYYRTLNLPSRSDVTRLATEVAELREAVLRLGDRVEELAERQDAAGRSSTAPTSAGSASPRRAAPQPRAGAPAKRTGAKRAPGSAGQPAEG